MWLYLCGIEAVPTKASPERQGGVGGTSHRDSKGSISIVKRHGLAFMQNGVWSAAQYFDTFGDKWRAQPGAVEWAREHGAQPFADATDTSESTGGMMAHADLSTGTFTAFPYFDDDDDQQQQQQQSRRGGGVPSVDPEAAKKTAASLSASTMEAPSAEKFCCSACGTVAADLKACRCKAVRYCGKACQVADWPTHKLVCTWKKKGGGGV